jgi:rubrerythrin
MRVNVSGGAEGACQMRKFRSVEAILAFAIEREAEAHAFYNDLVAIAGSSKMRATLENFSMDELRHKARLEAVRDGEAELMLSDAEDVPVPAEADEVEPRREMSYTDALALAIRKEDAAAKLYAKLAGKAKKPQLRELFEKLSREELEHKLRFEVEYALLKF